MSFTGFTRDLFDAYSEEKWASNAYNLTRMRGKDAMVALADALVARVGTRYDDLTRGHSDEIPTILNQKKVDSQWVYWTRNADEKKALSVLFEKLKLDGSALMTTATHDKHALVGLRADATTLTVSFRVSESAQVDCRNLAAKLRKPTYVDPFIALVAELPEGFEVCVGEFRSSRDLSSDRVSMLRTQLDQRPHTFEIVRRFDANEAVEAGSAILTPLAASLEALEPLYRFCAWSRENDHTEIGKQLQAVQAEKHAKALSFQPGQNVRVIGGMFKGKKGRVEDIDAKAKVRVRVGTLSVMISGHDLTLAD